MLPGPQIVVVDDVPEALDAIQKALYENGTSCLPVQVVNAKAQLRKPLKGVRLIFFDIHYLPGTPSGAATFDAAGLVLESVLAADNGPYILITWSTYAKQHDDFMKHLSKNFPNIPAPAMSAVMDKEQFKTGDKFEIEKIITKMEAIVSSNPIVNALLCWVGAAREAGDKVVLSLFDMLPRQERFLPIDGDKLNKLIIAIAQAALGKDNVKDNRLGAINEGLGPLLLDKLMHTTAEESPVLAATLEAAMPEQKLKDLVVLENEKKGILHSMHHLSLPDVDNVLPGHRGVACTLPEGCTVEQLTGIKEQKNLLKSYVKIKVDCDPGVLADHTRWVVVFLKPKCDQAQPKPGTNRAVLALEVSDPMPPGITKAKYEALYGTPCYQREGRIRRLYLNWQFLLPITDEQCNNSTALFRFRDSICSHMESHFANHAQRPGIIKFR